MNDQIRAEARGAKVPLWKIAAHIGVSEPTITRWMRFELPPDKEQKMRDAIAALRKGDE